MDQLYISLTDDSSNYYSLNRKNRGKSIFPKISDNFWLTFRRRIRISTQLFFQENGSSATRTQVVYFGQTADLKFSTTKNSTWFFSTPSFQIEKHLQLISRESAPSLLIPSSPPTGRRSRSDCAAFGQGAALRVTFERITEIIFHPLSPRTKPPHLPFTD